jgi:hypothetical protein
MNLIGTILSLAVQVFTFCITLAVKILSGIVGALWSAYQNRRPALQRNLAQGSSPRAKGYPRKRRKQWQRR